MRKIIVVLIALLFISGVLSYLYFDSKFTPPANQLKVSKHEDTVAISWASNQDTEYAALLLPVKLQGLSHIFYMQFDLGAHTTLFHDKALQSIQEKHPLLIFGDENDKGTIDFSLVSISISIPTANRMNYGKKINWNPSAINIIGTLGSDILEHKVVVMDFKQHLLSFANSFPEQIPVQSIQDFEFKKRKVLLNGKVNANPTQFYFDSGSSAFELITDKNQWERLALSGAVEHSYKANSWGNPLQVHTIAADAVITFGSTTIPLQEVSYIEGTSAIQKVLMYFSGMGGMIGNKLFMGRILVLDAKNQKFALLQSK